MDGFPGSGAVEQWLRDLSANEQTEDVHACVGLGNSWIVGPVGIELRWGV